jgi:hypothetical protein
MGSKLVKYHQRDGRAGGSAAGLLDKVNMFQHLGKPTGSHNMAGTVSGRPLFHHQMEMITRGGSADMGVHIAGALRRR